MCTARERDNSSEICSCPTRTIQSSDDSNRQAYYTDDTRRRITNVTRHHCYSAQITFRFHASLMRVFQHSITQRNVPTATFSNAADGDNYFLCDAAGELQQSEALIAAVRSRRCIKNRSRFCLLAEHSKKPQDFRLLIKVRNTCCCVKTLALHHIAFSYGVLENSLKPATCGSRDRRSSRLHSTRVSRQTEMIGDRSTAIPCSLLATRTHAHRMY